MNRVRLCGGGIVDDCDGASKDFTRRSIHGLEINRQLEAQAVVK